MRTNAVLFSLTLLTSAATLAQQSVPPLPKSADDSPSLEVTMKFIQDKLIDEDKFNFVLYVRDTQTKEEWSHQNAVDISKLRSDAPNCRFVLRSQTTVDGSTGTDKDRWIDLKSVTTLQVLPIEQDMKRVAIGDAHPTCEYRAEPTFFVVALRGADKQYSTLFVHDEDNANRIAKAMVHAVELCGGGSKPELF